MKIQSKDYCEDLYKTYAPSIAYIEVRNNEGDTNIGSAFHIGEGIFITARHVVENKNIISIGNTESWYRPNPNGLVHINNGKERYDLIAPCEGRIISGPYYHADDSIDIAALIVEGLDVPSIPLGGHLDDWINDSDFVLNKVIVMGYPPIPFSKKPLLFTARGEVNTIVDKYTTRHPHFIISIMPRGGFSGGVCISEWGFALGVVTESLLFNTTITELGYMAVLSVEPIYVCLQQNRIMPELLKEGWDGLWD